jgi:hypothetical protein
LYLNYCEAAAKAWGVKSDPNANGFTAYDVFKKVQARYGGKPNYLDAVVGTDVTKFVKYVLSERRIELSFEGHYFFDLRRNIADNSTTSLNVEVKGMNIVKNADNTYTYSRTVLESRKFPSPYLPIPYIEIANSPAVVQNAGWK